MKVLVTGAGGLLGGRLAALLSAAFEVVAARHETPPPRGLPEAPLDLLSPASLETALDQVAPDAIVHCAALADADLCEREPDLALRLNAGAAEVLARLCRRRAIRLVALSTDLVLAGDRARAPEDEPPRPQLAYGRTKLLGEQAVLAEAPEAAVARVALVVGRGHGARGTASETVAWALGSGRALRLYADELRTPIDTESVAAAVERLLRGSGRGLFHLGGSERLSRHELGLRVARLLRLPETGIARASQVEHPGPARRPPDVSLDSARAVRELGWAPRPLDAAIREGRPAPEGASRRV